MRILVARRKDDIDPIEVYFVAPNNKKVIPIPNMSGQEEKNNNFVEMKNVTFDYYNNRGGYLPEVIEAERALWTLSLSALFSCFCKRSGNYVTLGLLAFVPFILVTTMFVSWWLPFFIFAGRVLIPITERSDSVSSGRPSTRTSSLLHSSSNGSTHSNSHEDLREKSYWRRRNFYQQIHATRRTVVGLKRHSSLHGLDDERKVKKFHSMVNKKLQRI